MSATELTAKKFEPDAATCQGGSMPGEDSEQQPDELKSQFREALERKRGQQQGGNGAANRDSKIHEAHGKAGIKRQFRRKSG